MWEALGSDTRVCVPRRSSCAKNLIKLLFDDSHVASGPDWAGLGYSQSEHVKLSRWSDFKFDAVVRPRVSLLEDNTLMQLCEQQVKCSDWMVCHQESSVIVFKLHYVCKLHCVSDDYLIWHEWCPLCNFNLMKETFSLYVSYVTHEWFWPFTQVVLLLKLHRTVTIQHQ